MFGPSRKFVEIEVVHAEGLEPEDVDGHADDVHPEADLHLEKSILKIHTECAQGYIFLYLVMVVWF